MIITMHDVNFGECILYNEDDCQLLVDCGAKFGNKGQTAYNHIKTKINQNTDLLITHFDEDHYNGILAMPNKRLFTNIYLPYYLYDSSKGVLKTNDVFHMALMLWTYSIALGKPKKIKLIYQLFLKLPRLVKKISNIKCVKAGDNIILSSSNLRVLWPEVNYYAKRKKNYHLSVLLESFSSFENWQRLADDFISAVEEVYEWYCSDNRNDSDSVSLNSLLANMERKYKAMIKNTPDDIKLGDSEKKSYNSLNSKLIKDMNECSVVFDCEQTVIAFGDASPAVINYILPKLSQSYKVVKVQHHGTKAYWCNNIPCASAYLISNSGNAQINWGIYEEYGKLSSKACVVLCTNDTALRCGYYSGPPQRSHCSAQCNLNSHKNEIIVDTTTI